MTQEQEIAKLKIDLRVTRKVLGMLIVWIAQSSAGVIRQDEASELINILEGHE